MKERVFLFPQPDSASNEVTAAGGDAAGSGPATTGFWSRLAMRVRSWFEVPLGYEDESGFHYGVQPAPQAPRFAAEATSFRARVLTDRADHVMKHSVVLPTANPPASPAVVPEKQAEPVQS